ncbi:MAG: Mth938-like domain-containing protein [Rudaea sp.]
MLLTEHRNERQLFVRHADAAAVTVVDRALRRSFALSATRIVENLPVRRVGEIDAAAIDSILALEPEVVLLGTGDRAVFPPQAVLAQFLRRGIGVETMDNAAAARTFNVLAGEERRVVAVFLLTD